MGKEVAVTVNLQPLKPKKGLVLGQDGEPRMALIEQSAGGSMVRVL